MNNISKEQLKQMSEKAKKLPEDMKVFCDKEVFAALIEYILSDIELTEAQYLEGVGEIAADEIDEAGGRFLSAHESIDKLLGGGK